MPIRHHICFLIYYSCRMHPQITWPPSHPNSPTTHHPSLIRYSQHHNPDPTPPPLIGDILLIHTRRNRLCPIVIKIVMQLSIACSKLQLIKE